MSVFSDIKLPKLIHEAQTQYNGTVSVVEHGRTRKLIVNGYLQSTNWDSPVVKSMFLGRMVDVLQEQCPDMHSVLVLGIGGGTMQHLISQRFPNSHITSVDIDSGMVEIARQFFDLDKIPNHNVIINDACRVIVEPEQFGLREEMFNAALVDIFIGDKFPELGSSGNFIAALKKMVAPGGLIIFNRIYHGDHQDEVNQFIENLHDFLTDVQSVIIAGKTNSDNVLIFGRV